MTILEQIEQYARSAPDKVAHYSGGRSLTYGELIEGANRIAAHIVTSVGSGNGRSPIAVYGHKEPEMLIGFLGAIRSGHPYVPIDTSLPAERVNRIIEVSGATLTLTPDDIGRLIRDRSGMEYMPSATLGPDDPFYIMFTSGSTGDPKGVIITERNLESFVSWMREEQQLGQGEVFLDQAPFSFDLSVMDLYPCLCTGNTLHSITKDTVANPAALYTELAGSNITTWVSTPSFAQLCCIEKTFDASRLPSLRRMLFCGETLSPQLASTLAKRFPDAKIWNTYGPTEATVATTSVHIDQALLDRYQSLPVGYPQPESTISIMDEDSAPVASGETGEIVISGPHVSPGYLGRPDLTQRAFFTLAGQAAYRTGDRGHMTDGMLFFEGRADNQVKLHGYRIELGDVESNLQALPAVRDAVVVVAMKDGLPHSLAAFVILQPSEDMMPMTEQELKAALAKRVPPYMIPRKFCVMERFPMTANGKADRKTLAAQAAL